MFTNKNNKSEFVKPMNNSLLDIMLVGVDALNNQLDNKIKNTIQNNNKKF